VEETLDSSGKGEGRCRAQKKARPMAMVVEAGGAEVDLHLQYAFVCWREEIFISPTSTVHRRQTSICLSKLFFIVGVSLSIVA
jgi:hypothetical protein